jgi:hypothetical protein
VAAPQPADTEADHQHRLDAVGIKFGARRGAGEKLVGAGDEPAAAGEGLDELRRDVRDVNRRLLEGGQLGVLIGDGERRHLQDLARRPEEAEGEPPTPRGGAQRGQRLLDGGAPVGRIGPLNEQDVRAAGQGRLDLQLAGQV